MTYEVETAGDVLNVVEDRRVGRSALAALLTGLEARDIPEGVTVYSAPGKFQESLRTLQDMKPPAQEWLKAIGPRVESSETGAVLFWSESGLLAILPPFPFGEQPGRKGLGYVAASLAFCEGACHRRGAAPTREVFHRRVSR